MLTHGASRRKRRLSRAKPKSTANPLLSPDKPRIQAISGARGPI